MSRTTQRTAKKAGGIKISERTKKILLITSACVIVIGGSLWAYYTLSTVPPPNIETAAADDVAGFLGNGRGFARMSVPQREEYLYRVVERNARGENRDRFNQALRSMSRSERQIFLDAFFDVGRVRMMERARDYNKLPRREKAVFIDNTIRDFQRLQRAVGGGGASRSGGGPYVGNAVTNKFDNSLAEPFKGDLPSSSDEFTKSLVTRTSASERAEAQPLVDALAERYKELKDDPRTMARFQKGL